MSTRRFRPVLLGLAACASLVAGFARAASQDAPQEPELGTLGFQPPEVSDIRLVDTLVHQDQTGGVAQDLMGISGSGAPGGGFGLVWRDQRDGMLGLYFVRLGPDGQRREDERSITSVPSTVRKFDPAVAIAPDGSGAVAWISMRQDAQQRSLRPWLRCFNAEGQFYGTDLPLGDAPAPGRARSGRDEAGGPSRSPVVLARADGTRTVVWTVDGRLRVGDFDVAGSPLRATYDLGPAGTDPEAGISAVADASGGVAALWTGKGKIWFACRGGKDKKSEETQLGDGQARALAVDPTGGYWALWQRGDAVVLRHVSAAGQADRAETSPVPGAVRACDMAVHANGVAIAVLRGGASAPAGRERGGRGRNDLQRPGAARGETRQAAAAEQGDAHVELWLCDPRGALAQPEPLAISSEAARNVSGAFVASNGQNLLVAWTDARLGDADVWARVVDPTAEGDARLKPELRINSDGPSADQINPDVDVAGERGLTVWQDRRTTGSQIYARRFHTTGLTGDEICLPAKFGDAAVPDLPGGAVEPSVALRADGTALVTWIQRAEGRDKAVAQILAPDGRAASGLIEIDAREGFLPDRVALSALPADRGWLAVWPGGGKNGVWSRRIAPDGALPGPARRVSEPTDDVLSSADVTLLDDGRLVAAWSLQRAGSTANEGWFVRARFLDADGGTKGSELGFEPSRRNQDHDPALAPAKGGGFLMAWCSGPPGDPTHDVNVRLFDAQGKPAAPILTPCFLANEQDFPDLARLSDGTFVIAWEDDISYFDQAYVRRIQPDGRTMGPWMRIGKLDTRFVPDRIVPRIAAMGAGWAAVVVDRQRSLGFDVRVKVVGPGFDQASGG